MPSNCETRKDVLMDLAYGEKGTDPSLQSHLQSCAECQETLKSYEDLRVFCRSALPDLEPPARLTTNVFKRMEEEKEAVVGFFGWMGRWLLHPASVAALVFTFTLGGSLVYKRYFSTPQGPSVASKGEIRSAPSAPSEVSTGLSVAPPSAPIPASYVRMVDWNPAPRLIPDLDRPVLRVADMASLEQASIESVASFKHQVAMRHILDGDYDKASRILDSVINNYMNYSHWDQAVLLHLSVMKKMGRPDEIQRDLRRLREYAMANPDFVSQVEQEYKN